MSAEAVLSFLVWAQCYDRSCIDDHQRFTEYRSEFKSDFARYFLSLDRTEKENIIEEYRKTAMENPTSTRDFFYPEANNLSPEQIDQVTNNLIDLVNHVRHRPEKATQIMDPLFGEDLASTSKSEYQYQYFVHKWHTQMNNPTQSIYLYNMMDPFNKGTLESFLSS